MKYVVLLWFSILLEIFKVFFGFVCGYFDYIVFFRFFFNNIKFYNCFLGRYKMDN